MLLCELIVYILILFPCYKIIKLHLTGKYWPTDKRKTFNNTETLFLKNFINIWMRTEVIA